MKTIPRTVAISRIAAEPEAVTAKIPRRSVSDEDLDAPKKEFDVPEQLDADEDELTEREMSAA